MHAGGGVEHARMALRQLQRHRVVLAAGAGHHHLRHPGLARALQDRVQVALEAFVGEVGADVDQVHGAVLRFAVSAHSSRAPRPAPCIAAAMKRAPPGITDNAPRFSRDSVLACRPLGTTSTPAMDFPISPLLPAIRDSLATHPRLVLEAPPGAGKTTQVPLALLDAPWLQGRRMLRLEPRRVAARSAAASMPRQLGEEAGGTVGYRIRFESRVSARTRIEVVTEDILTRLIQDDPLLEGVGALLFDEFHERHLSAGLGLALALDVQAQLREDLRLVVMSATLDGERLARFLDAPRLSSEGRSYPVEVSHFPARRDESLEAQARRAIEQALVQHPGDVLVFLPGQREIARVGAALDAASLPAGVEVLALHGELPVEQQSKVLQPAPDGRRRVVLATNVAESSVTLPGVRVVIDSGLAREPRFDPVSGFSRLDAVPISQASADQRAGRAGRVAPGVAWRLWPQSQRLEAQRRPEMAQVELAGLALELAAWGSDALRFVDPPPPGALASARELLQRLGALDGGAITALGRRMLELGTH